MPPEPKKGELNKLFNIHVERPFFVVTELPSERFLDIIKHNIVLKTRNGFPSQKWYFDQKSRTIKSVRDKQSWSLASNGKSNNMQVWGTNSGWFQLYKYDGSTFLNVYTKKVLTVDESKDSEGQNVSL